MAVAAAAFDKLDINGDGDVERGEILALAQKESTIAQKVNQSMLEEFFTTFDADGDGKVQKEEWLLFFGKIFDDFVSKQLE